MMNGTNYSDSVHYQDPEEQVADYKPPSASGSGSLPAVEVSSCRNANEYYQKLSEAILTFDSRPRVILLASDDVQALPVTVAINLAIQLVRQKQKVLLVDTDEARNAVAAAFDMDPALVQKKVRPSSLEKLSVCCIPVRKLHRFLQKDEILNHFETTLIYTPNVPMVKLPPEDAARPAAFYFTDEDNPNAVQMPPENLGFCRCLCTIPSIQAVLNQQP